MNDTSHEVPAGPIDCNALKALLSPYLDDELTRDERLRADAHLVACGGCRTLVERAEALDEELRAKFADDLADADAEFAANPIDIAAFQARVLEAIGHEQRRTWIPRVAVHARQISGGDTVVTVVTAGSTGRIGAICLCFSQARIFGVVSALMCRAVSPTTLRMAARLMADYWISVAGTPAPALLRARSRSHSRDCSTRASFIS